MFKKLLIIFFLIFLTGCYKSENNNIDVPDLSDNYNKITSPYIRNFGSYIIWNECKNANQYEIYVDNVLIDTVVDEMYDLGTIKKNINLYVKACNNSIKSEKSNEISVDKNSNFNTNEILDLTTCSSYIDIIGDNIKKIIISNNIELDLEIADRKNDLIFELNNASIIGSIYTESKNYNKQDLNYNVIFNLNGDSSIKALNGINGDDFSNSAFDNLEKDAGEGTNGKDTLIVPSLVVFGQGNLSIIAGDGGDGGIGSSTTTWEAVNGPGKGANGGDGGKAIQTSTVFLNFVGEFNVQNGKGGLKGKPGNNGSIITGPAASMMWDDVYDIGEDGNDGVSIINETIDLR